MHHAHPITNQRNQATNRANSQAAHQVSPMHARQLPWIAGQAQVSRARLQNHRAHPFCPTTTLPSAPDQTGQRFGFLQPRCLQADSALPPQPPLPLLILRNLHGLIRSLSHCAHYSTNRHSSCFSSRNQPHPVHLAIDDPNLHTPRGQESIHRDSLRNHRQRSCSRRPECDATRSAKESHHVCHQLQACQWPPNTAPSNSHAQNQVGARPQILRGTV